MNGIELAAKLLEKRKEIPIILSTGFSTSITQKTMDSIGIQTLLNKPVLKQEMAQTLRKVLDDNGAND